MSTSRNVTSRVGKSRVPESIVAQSTAVVGDSEDRRLSEYWSEADICPQCKTDRYLNPRLRLLVSRCYHKMCETCIDRLFSLGPAPCPECGLMLRKEQFAPQRFENLQVQKEVVTRQRLGRIFNKTENDFDDPKKYDDYLEEIEELTFNLINNIDLENTEARVRQYEAKNKEEIAKNQKRLEQERDRVMKEEQQRLQKAQEERRHWEEHDKALRADEEARRQAVLNGLATLGGNASTEDIIERAQREKEKRILERERDQYGASNKQSQHQLVDPFPPDSDADYRLDITQNVYSVHDRYIDIPGMSMDSKTLLIAHAGGYDVRLGYTKAISASVSGWM